MAGGGGIVSTTGTTGRALPDVSTALAVAIRRVNVEYFALDPDDRPQFGDRAWRQLEEQLATAADAGDRRAALEAVQTWEKRAKAVIRGTA